MGGQVDAADAPADVARCIAGAAAEDFDGVALRAHAHQVALVPALRNHAARRPPVRSWRDVPLVPTRAFKTMALHADAPRETFRSSGTGGERSVHHHPYPELYRAAIDASFPRFCLLPGERPPILSLVPPRAVVPDSSLGFMAEHVLATHAEAEHSAVAVGARGLELQQARSWLGARQREGRPVLVFATALALAQLVDGLRRLDLRFRLAPGSRLFETGGFKTRTGELDREELLAGVAEFLAVPREAVIREYGMTELTSQFYTDVLRGGADDLFVAPPWTRVRVLDPATLAEAPAGTVGVLAIFDLANVGSALHLLTEDLGRSDGEGFRLVGRAAGAELRGCSLALEELRGG